MLKLACAEKGLGGSAPSWPGPMKSHISNYSEDSNHVIETEQAADSYGMVTFHRVISNFVTEPGKTWYSPVCIQSKSTLMFQQLFLRFISPRKKMARLTHSLNNYCNFECKHYVQGEINSDPPKRYIKKDRFFFLWTNLRQSCTLPATIIGSYRTYLATAQKISPLTWCSWCPRHTSTYHRGLSGWHSWKDEWTCPSPNYTSLQIWQLEHAIPQSNKRQRSTWHYK